VQKLRLHVHPLERLVANVTPELKTNDPLVLTAGTNTLVGIASRVSGNILEIDLKNMAIVEKDEKISISKRIDNRWRLIGYGVVQ
jgi:translation initiation factor 2 subunit 3